MVRKLPKRGLALRERGDLVIGSVLVWVGVKMGVRKAMREFYAKGYRLGVGFCCDG